MLDGSDGKMAAAIVQMACLYRGMLAVRATGITTLIPGMVPSQFRAFSVRKEPELDDNPYFSKYQEKIQRLRRSVANRVSHIRILSQILFYLKAICLLTIVNTSWTIRNYVV